MGETGPAVVSPSVSAQARGDIVAMLNQLIESFTEVSNVAPVAQASSATNNVPLLLDAVEAGRLLSISRTKVLDLAARGEIPSLRIGGSVRIPRDSLQTWIAERTNGRSTTSVPLPEWAHRWSNES